eukprot:11659390-Ditylum_brightwellii.AAC.1
MVHIVILCATSKESRDRDGCIDPKPQEHWDNDFITILATIPMEDEMFIGLDTNAGLNDSKFAKIVNSRNL